MARDIRFGMVIEAVDRATAPLRKVSGAVTNLTRRTGLRRVGRDLSAVGTQFGKIGREATRTARTVSVAIAATVGAFLSLTTGFANTGDQIAKTADKLGLGIVELQRLRHAGNLAGIEQRTLDMGLQRFTRRVAEAAAGTGEAREALKFLGLQLTDNEGRIRPTETLLAEAADALMNVEDQALRVRIAFKLFDSEGVAMVNMLQNGGDAMRAAGDEAERLGIVTEDQARAAERYKDNMTRLRGAVKGLGYTIGADLLPLFEPWLVKLRELTLANRGDILASVRGGIADLVQMFAAVRGWIGRTVETLRGWYRALADAFPLIAKLGDRLRAWVNEIGLLRIAVAGVALAMSAKLAFAIAGLFGPLLKLGVSLAIATVKMLLFSASLLANPITWIVLGIAALAAGAVLVYRNWDKIAAWWSNLWAGIREKFAETWDTISTAVVGFGSRLRVAFSETWDAVWAEVVGFADRMKTAAGDWIDKLLEGFRDRWAAVTAWWDDAVGSLLGKLPDWIRTRIEINPATSGAPGRSATARRRTARTAARRAAEHLRQLPGPGRRPCRRASYRRVRKRRRPACA